MAIAEGVASAADIDTAMTLGANYPQGPLALADPPKKPEEKPKKVEVQRTKKELTLEDFF